MISSRGLQLDSGFGIEITSEGSHKLWSAIGDDGVRNSVVRIDSVMVQLRYLS